MRLIILDEPLTSKIWDWDHSSGNGSASNLSYSSEGTKVSSVCQTSTPVLTDSNHWEMTFQLKPTTATRVSFGVGIFNHGYLDWRTDISNTFYFNKNVLTANAWNEITIHRDNDDFYAIVNGTQSSTVTYSNCNGNRLALWKWGGGNLIVRNLKLTLI